MPPDPERSAPDAVPLSGRLLGGRYRVAEVIGRGGMSTVYRALDERLARPVALKVIRDPTGEEVRAHLRERFRREAASAARVPPHPNVVQIYDYGTDPEEDLDYIAMELLHGRDLKDALRQREFSSSHAVRILLEAARGLAAGHEAGLVHRDVKPSNLFLVGAERLEAVRVLDFGIAKAFETEDPDDELTWIGGLPHTPAYTSPEQRGPTPRLTPASDVYQWGLVAYEVLAGERPFTAAERERIVRGENVPLPARGRWSAVPSALQALVQRALDPDAEARYPDGATLAESLARIDLQGGEEPEPEEDHTVLAPPRSKPGDDGAATEFAPIEPPPAAPSAGPGPPSPALAPRIHERATTFLGSGAARILLLGSVVALALWGVLEWAGGPSVPEPPVDPRSVQELEDEFAPLYADASARLAEESSLPGEEEAAVQVRRVIRDASEAWERGELERHLTHYAGEVEVEGEEMSRDALGRERREERGLYDEVEVTAEPQRVEFPKPDRADVQVYRSWRFAGEGVRREGEAPYVLVLEHEDGRWRIVAEREGTLSEADSPE